MELVLGLVCDEARADEEGRLDVKGAFHDLFAPGFPARQDRMTLVLVLEWDRSDHGRYQFTVNLEDPEGRPSLSVRGHSDVDARTPDRAPARTRLVMPLEEVVFPVPGPYRFRVQVKGRQVDGPVLHLVRTEPETEAVPVAAPAPGSLDPERPNPERRDPGAGR